MVKHKFGTEFLRRFSYHWLMVLFLSHIGKATDGCAKASWTASALLSLLWGFVQAVVMLSNFIFPDGSEHLFGPFLVASTAGCWSTCRSEQIKHFMFACLLLFGDATELEVRQRYLNPNPAVYWRSLHHFSVAWWSLLFFPYACKLRRLLEITCSGFSLVY